MAACSRLNVRAVAGVELSADYPSTKHILGYRFDYTHPRLAETLESVRKARDWRNEEMCRNLRKLGFDITLEEVEAEAAGDVVARPHMAKVMVRKDMFRTWGLPFPGTSAIPGPHTPTGSVFSPEDCISLIREAGGVAVLAHPVQTAESYAEIRLIAGKLKNGGSGAWNAFLQNILPNRFSSTSPLLPGWGFSPRREATITEAPSCRRP